MLVVSYFHMHLSHSKSVTNTPLYSTDFKVLLIHEWAEIGTLKDCCGGLVDLHIPEMDLQITKNILVLVLKL